MKDVTLYANDNGMMLWPPECELERWDKPVAQAWEKWEHDYERIKHRNWQRRVRCKGRRLAGVDRAGQSMWRPCDEVFEGIGSWRRHCLTEHPGRAVEGSPMNERWVWELLGFADHWDGKPRGWYDLLDGDDPSVRQWEYDALELGTVAADYWWVEPPAP